MPLRQDTLLVTNLKGFVTNAGLTKSPGSTVSLRTCLLLRSYTGSAAGQLVNEVNLTLAVGAAVVPEDLMEPDGGL